MGWDEDSLPQGEVWGGDHLTQALPPVGARAEEIGRRRSAQAPSRLARCFCRIGCKHQAPAKRQSPPLHHILVQIIPPVWGRMKVPCMNESGSAVKNRSPSQVVRMKMLECFRRLVARRSRNVLCYLSLLPCLHATLVACAAFFITPALRSLHTSQEMDKICTTGCRSYRLPLWPLSTCHGSSSPSPHDSAHTQSADPISMSLSNRKQCLPTISLQVFQNARAGVLDILLRDAEGLLKLPPR